MSGISPQAPKSLLGRHRLLAPTASVRVSPLCLGGMSIGNRWKAAFGECTRETAFELLDAFYDLGGNFIDTANVYQGGESEEWIGEWMSKTPGRRDEMVLSTKYALAYRAGQPVQQSNFGGTGTKSMHGAIESSLRKFQTTYIDLYVIHNWDFATGIPELMQSLNTLVQQGKVLYLGISDTPAWLVIKANCYAQEHGLRPFSVYQGRFGAHARDLERDVIPMCQSEGMAIQAWGVMGNGSLKAPDSAPEDGSRNAAFILNGKEAQVSQALDVVAKRLGVSIPALAIAYVMHKATNIFPIIGGRKVAHLRSNVEALGMQLGAKDIADIEKGYPFDTGFPNNFLNHSGQVPTGPEHVDFLRELGVFDYVQGQQPIKPHQEE